MAKRIDEFRQERIDYERFHKTAWKEIAPIFRKALNQSVKPTLDFINNFGLDALNIVTPPINSNVWTLAYNQSYELLGMKSARKEFYRQRNLDGLYQEKSSAIELLIDVWSSILRDYALNYTYLISRELNARTIAIIQKALGDTLALGLDSQGAIRLFEKTLRGELRLRTGLISRTEAMRISNLGKDVGARSYLDNIEGQSYKVWLGRADKRERQTHIDENNTLIELESKFDVGGFLADRPGDTNLPASEVINCRCTVSYLSQNRYNYYKKRGRIVGNKLVGSSGNRG